MTEEQHPWTPGADLALETDQPMGLHDTNHILSEVTDDGQVFFTDHDGGRSVFLPTAEPPDPKEAFDEAYQSLQSVRDSWIFSLSRKNRKDLKHLAKNLNVLMAAISRLQFDVQKSEAKQIEVIDAMETVRERNRLLEQKFIDSGLSRGELSEPFCHPEQEWENAVTAFGKHTFNALKPILDGDVILVTFKGLATAGGTGSKVSFLANEGVKQAYGEDTVKLLPDKSAKPKRPRKGKS